MVPRDAITSMLGMTSNTSLNTMKVPPKATSGQACSYVGKDNSATIILMRFESSVAARQYLKTVRDGLEKASIKTVTEKFGAETGFSFASGMLAVKNSTFLRVGVIPKGATGQVSVIPDLTRQLLLVALKSN